MNQQGLVQFFMRRRRCSFDAAVKMADAVVIRKKLQRDEALAKLERAQLTLGLDGQPAAQEPSCKDDEPGPYGVVPF